MSALATAVLLIASVVMLAGTLVAYRALWRGLRDQWRAIPPERRPRAIATGVATATFIATGIALAIAAPWGPDSIVYVLLFGFGCGTVLILIGVAVQAVRDTRRARRHRPERT